MTARKNLLRSLAIIVASFVIGFSVLWWLQNDIATQAAKAEEMKIGAARESDLIGVFATLKNDAGKANAYERRLAGLLPPKDKLLDFDNFLEVLGNQHRVSTNFSFDGEGTPTGDGNVGSINFKLEVTGPLSGIQGLLEDLELKPRSYLLSFDTFTVSLVDEGYRAVLRGKIFYKESETTQ